jgi:Domain of unknown function (DUF5134)
MCLVEAADVAGPSWLAGAFAAVMIVIAVYCAGRLVASRLWHRATAVDADGLHVVMGVAMAGMLAPRLSLLPGSVWEGGFAGAAAWFAWQAARAGRGSLGGGWRCHYPVPHLVECGAMLYMLRAAPGTRPAGAGTGMPMPAMSAPPGSFPALALILALFMLGYIVWTTDRLTSGARANSATTARSTATDHARVLVNSGAPAASPPEAPDPPGTSGPAGTGQEDPANVPMLAPRLAEFYKIAMGIAMGYMLILML